MHLLEMHLLEMHLLEMHLLEMAIFETILLGIFNLVLLEIHVDTHEFFVDKYFVLYSKNQNITALDANVALLPQNKQ